MEYLNKILEFILNAPKTVIILLGIGLVLLIFACCKSENRPKTDIYHLLDFSTMGDTIYLDSTYAEFDTLADMAPTKLARLVIHCTGSNIKNPYTRESLLNFFSRIQKWSKPGYTFFIDREGILWKLNEHFNWDPIIEYSEITFGAKGYNSTSLHIAWDGGVVDGKITDNRTNEQKDALRTFVYIVTDIYPNIEVIGHKDLPNVHKACPIFDVKKEYKNILQN
jgi:N-acetylmuramoyl-L-alanine amidase